MSTPAWRSGSITTASDKAAAARCGDQRRHVLSESRIQEATKKVVHALLHELDDHHDVRMCSAAAPCLLHQLEVCDECINIRVHKFTATCVRMILQQALSAMRRQCFCQKRPALALKTSQAQCRRHVPWVQQCIRSCTSLVQHVCKHLHVCGWHDILVAEHQHPCLYHLHSTQSGQLMLTACIERWRLSSAMHASRRFKGCASVQSQALQQGAVQLHTP